MLAHKYSDLSGICNVWGFTCPSEAILDRNSCARLSHRGKVLGEGPPGFLRPLWACLRGLKLLPTAVSPA